MSDFPEYPKNHPIWKDINFTPDWIYQKILEEPEQTHHQHQQQQSKKKPSSTNNTHNTKPRETTYRNTNSSTNERYWSKDEDLVLIYLQSKQGMKDGMTFPIVANALKRQLLIYLNLFIHVYLLFYFKEHWEL